MSIAGFSTTAEIAATAGVTVRGVLKRAQLLGLTPATVIGRSKMWTAAQARELAKPMRIGAPEGNQNAKGGPGRPRPKGTR